VGEEVLLNERQVLLLGIGQLGVRVVGIGLHNRMAGFPNQEGQVNVQDGSTVIAWAQREETDRDSSCWEVGRHPRFASFET